MPRRLHLCPSTSARALGQGPTQKGVKQKQTALKNYWIIQGDHRAHQACRIPMLPHSHDARRPSTGYTKHARSRMLPGLPHSCYHTLTPVSPFDPPPPHFRGSRQMVGLVSYNSLSLSDHSMISSSLEPAPSSSSLSRVCRHGHHRSRVRVRGPRGLGIRPLLKGTCHEPLHGIFHERAVTCGKGPPCSEHSSVN